MPEKSEPDMTSTRRLANSRARSTAGSAWVSREMDTVGSVHATAMRFQGRSNSRLMAAVLSRNAVRKAASVTALAATCRDRADTV